MAGVGAHGLLTIATGTGERARELRETRDVTNHVDLHVALTLVDVLGERVLADL